MTKKKKIIILVCFLLVFCFLLIDKCLQMMSVGLGGQVLKSPNGQYEAYVNALETPALLTKFKRYYELSIYDIGNISEDSLYRYSDENQINCFRLEIPHEKKLINLRGSENNIIEWFPDSSRVTYSFEDIEIKINVNKEQTVDKEKMVR